jgi:hypothetical protein
MERAPYGIPERSHLREDRRSRKCAMCCLPTPVCVKSANMLKKGRSSATSCERRMKSGGSAAQSVEFGYSWTSGDATLHCSRRITVPTRSAASMDLNSPEFDLRNAVILACSKLTNRLTFKSRDTGDRPVRTSTVDQPDQLLFLVFHRDWLIHAFVQSPFVYGEKPLPVDNMR